jgi:hypothetical protein
MTKSIIILSIFISVFMVNAFSQEIEENINTRLTNLYGDYLPYQTFFQNMKSYFANNDSTQISNIIQYPIQIIINDKKSNISNKKEFIKNYSKYITNTIKKAVKDQEYDSLFANSEGLMIGNGQIWFTGICKDDKCIKIEVKIIAINP